MFRSTCARALWLTFVVLISTALFSQVGGAQSKPEKIDVLMQKYNEYRQFNGSVLVAEEGKVIFKKGYGQANKEWNIPNAPDTKFRLGSITKQFTSMLIMQLVEQGKIKLDGRIIDYLPDYPKSMGEKITIHHLLTHTSGIPNYTSLPNFQQELSRTPYTPAEFLKVFWNLPLDFELGTKFSYSNSGYFVLGTIIEKVTGKPYARVLDENIFKPLDMRNSGYDTPTPILTKRAAGYQKRGGDFVNAAYIDMTVPFSAGSLYSTVEDLYLWDQALYGDKLLPEKYKALMFAPQVKTGIGPGSLERYAYGWFIGREPAGSAGDSVFAISHGGSISGFTSLIGRIPEKKCLVVLLNNTGPAPVAAIAQGILGILFDKPYGGVTQSLADVLRDKTRASGIDAAISQFRELRSDKKEYFMSEDEINSLGYEYLQAGKMKEAIEVFKLNVESFPKSYNVYDSLGEACAAAGEKELAIKNYEKSLELNPKSQSGIDALKKLKAQ